jgi:DNA-binding XRE family transcriptional regulator
VDNWDGWTSRPPLFAILSLTCERFVRAATLRRPIPARKVPGSSSSRRLLTKTAVAPERKGIRADNGEYIDTSIFISANRYETLVMVPSPTRSGERAHISRVVRDLRKERGWTQAELAGKLGLSQSRLSEVERGDGSFTAEQFLQILRLFNVAVDRFLGETDRSLQLQNALARLVAWNRKS